MGLDISTRSLGVGRYRGRIRSFSEAKGFGFIDCAERFGGRWEDGKMGRWEDHGLGISLWDRLKCGKSLDVLDVLFRKDRNILATTWRISWPMSHLFEETMQQFGRDVFVHKFQLHESGAWVRDSRRNLRWAELDQLGCRLTRIEDISAWGWLCDTVVIHSLYPITSHNATPVILISVLLNAAPIFFCSCCPILQVFSFKQQLRNSTHDHLGLVKI